MFLSICLVIICGLGPSICDYTYQIKYLNVPLDHFTYTDNRTFKVRFLINDSYWNKEDGPIYFYTGGDTDIRDIANTTGFVWESAEELGALVVFAEQRYYGESLPFGNLSLTNAKYFGYLSTPQVLADFVDIIYYIKSGTWQENDYQETLSNPVIAVGDALGGLLAAWLRMKYPTAVEGALVSSAPLFMFTGMSPCDIGDQHVTIIFNSTEYKNCAALIKRSWDVINDFAANETGKQWLNENWKLCTPLRKDADIDTLKEVISDFYRDAAVGNYPYEADVFVPLPPNPVNEMCSRIKDVPDEEEFLTYVFDALSVYLNWTGDTDCLDWEDDTFDSESNAYYIQWCTELVSPTCSTGINDMFEPVVWDEEDISDQCFNGYGVRPINDFVQKTYGDRNTYVASNIIFSNGIKDPWSTLGVLRNLSPSAIAIIIEEAAHQLDIRGSHPNDPKSVRVARSLYNNIFKKWTKNYYAKKQHRYNALNLKDLLNENFHEYKLITQFSDYILIRNQ